MTKQFYQQGQVAIATILAMVVLLTVGLSVATRTTQDALQTEQQIESTRVFNAAELGIEEALSQSLSDLVGTNFSVNSDPNISASVQVSADDFFEGEIKQGRVAHIQISEAVNGLGAGSNRRLLFEWGQDGSCNDASLYVLIISNTGAGNQVRHIGLAPHNCNRGDDFQLGGVGTGRYATQTTIDLDQGDQIARVMPVYAATKARITAQNVAIPNQIFTLDSASQGTEFEQGRTIQVVETRPAAPSIFNFAVFSGVGLSKSI